MSAFTFITRSKTHENHENQAIDKGAEQRYSKKEPFSVLRSPLHYRRNFSVLALVLAITFTACGGGGGGGGGNGITGGCTHTWQWKVTTPPNFTVSTPGEETGTCSNCGATGTREYPIYKLGDTGPGGGKIFYVADGQGGRTLGFTVEGYTGATRSFATYTAHYLEAAPTNETNSSWGDSYTQVAGITTHSLSTAINTIIGNGRKDTMLNVAFLEGLGHTTRAAPRAASATHGGKNDWFLPSLGELNQLYINRTSVGSLGTSQYWSSSQDSTGYAWLQNLENGTQASVTKMGVNSVRAIRAF